VKVWDKRTLNAATSSVVLESAALALDWNPFSEVFAVGCQDGSLHVFDLRKLTTPVSQLKKHYTDRKLHAINCVSFSPHSKDVLAFGSDDHRLLSLSLASAQPSLLYEWKHVDYVRGVGWSPQKQALLASASWDKTVNLHTVAGQSTGAGDRNCDMSVEGHR